MPAKRVVDEDEIRQSVCLTGDPASSIGKILYELYITRITAARAGYLDEINAAALAQGGGSVASNAQVDSLVRAVVDVVRSGGTGDLAAVLADVTGIKTNTNTKVAGKIQPAATTESLNQAAATYDLFTGTAQKVVLKSLVVSMPTGAAGGAITSISIQTDAATPQVIISSTQGAVANLTSEAQLAWTGAIVIPVGAKIQLTIAGGAHGSAYTVTIDAECTALVSGGHLA